MARVSVAFDRQCELAGLPTPTPEYQFAKDDGRKWRVDWCFIEQRVALEVEGGVFIQGFPDDYTLIPYNGKSSADGPRYKAIGNSMAVPVVRWILQRIEWLDQHVTEAS